MAKRKNKNRTKVQAMKTAKRDAMKDSGFLDGRFHTRTHEPSIKQKNRRDRRDSKKNIEKGM